MNSNRATFFQNQGTYSLQMTREAERSDFHLILKHKEKNIIICNINETVLCRYTVQIYSNDNRIKSAPPPPPPPQKKKENQ